ncbi:hypothetical protein DFH09DRAFT_191901 [Mycena vulgaris]|nr:hypothetical protein DFH09DRAFT_191901 [Mycena vulgaris]
MNNPRETPVIPLVPRVPEIFSLPNELLVAIAAAGQENRLPLWLDRDGAFKSESTLSHVCRHLRAAIIGAPELWTLVEADLDLDGSVENFKLYLERSRASKIWVTVREFGLEPDILSEHIALLLPHTHRIWRLGIMSTVNSINAMLDPFRDVAAPCLEHLEIYRDELLPGPFPLEMFASGQPAHLSILKLDGFTPRFPIPKWATSITHLKLRRGQEVDGLDGKRLFVAMVQQCRSLVHLYLDTNVLHRPEVIGRISIPSLKSLHLLLWNHGSNHLLVRVFRVLDTPALTDITIDCAHGHDISELFNPMSLPDSSFPALKSLSFNSYGCGREGDPVAIHPPPPRLFPAVLSHPD